MQRGQAVPEHPGAWTPGQALLWPHANSGQAIYLRKRRLTGAGLSRTLDRVAAGQNGVGGRTGSQEEGEGTYMVHNSHTMTSARAPLENSP